MASFKDWLEGARLRTLPAAAAPVFIGAGAAYHLGGGSLGKSLLALGVALALQIGVNFANDYSDGKKGTDEKRVGPTRLTASGLVPPKTVLAMALGSFGIAGLLGFALIAWAGTWWMLAVGAAAVAAAWFYTGGARPYGYMGVGLSEVFVFVFFGLVATIGTTYVQSYSAPSWLWVAASGIGLVSIALLMVNNIRDIPTDSQVGKTTIAVRMGDRPARILYAVLMALAVLAGAFALGTATPSAGVVAACGGPAVGADDPTGFTGRIAMLFAVSFILIFLPLALGPVRQVLSGASGKDLLPPLRNTGLFALAYGVVLGIGFALSAGASGGGVV